MWTFYIVIYTSLIYAYVIREIKNAIFSYPRFQVLSCPVKSDLLIGIKQPLLQTTRIRTFMKTQNLKIMFVRGLILHLTDRLTKI